MFGGLLMNLKSFICQNKKVCATFHRMYEIAFNGLQSFFTNPVVAVVVYAGMRTPNFSIQNFIFLSGIQLLWVINFFFINDESSYTIIQRIYYYYFSPPFRHGPDGYTWRSKHCDICDNFQRDAGDWWNYTL